MVAEVEHQVPLEQARRLVREVPAAEVGWIARPPSCAIRLRSFATAEAHDAGALAVDLDDEAPKSSGSRSERSISSSISSRVVARRAGEVRVDVVVRRQLDEEVDVVGPRAPDRDAHGRAGSTASARAGRQHGPEPSATPLRISASPTIIQPVISSSSRNAP